MLCVRKRENLNPIYSETIFNLEFNVDAILNWAKAPLSGSDSGGGGNANSPTHTITSLLRERDRETRDYTFILSNLTSSNAGLLCLE